MVLTEQQVREKLKTYVPLVQKYNSPISVATRLAQLIVESQMFTSELALKSNNGFGIKASAPWTGDSVPHVSGEVGGARESEFRKYPSHEASIKDHAEFFTSTPFRQTDKVYGLAIKATNYKDEAKYLGPKFKGDTSSYAGDPNYAAKLIDKVERYNLTQYETKKGNDTMSKLTLEQAFAKLGLPFKKQLLPLTKTYGRVNRKEGTVIHQTGAPQAGKTAQWMANYQKSMSSPSNGEEKSWNYQVDDKEVIMSFEHNVATWQSSDGRGPGNMAHISIESCINSDGNYAKGIDNLAKLMAVIAYVEGFDIEKNTKRHYDFARDKKWCPAQIMNGKEGFTYAKVKQMAQAHLNTLNGAKAEPVDVHNPQNLTESKPLDYKAPRLPFETLKLGGKATLLDDKNSNGDYIWLWYNPTNNTLLKSKRQAELAGTTDTIKEVKKIDKIQHSQYAYLLKDTNSWILEEYLEEPRKNWEVVEVDDEDKVEDGKEVEPLKDGQFWWNDVLYQINEVK